MKLPKNLCWNITCRCNEKCTFCYRTASVPELSVEENKKIIRKLADAGVKEITWTGGEALLYSGLVELMEYAKFCNLSNGLITNGKIVDEKIMDQLASLVSTLTISLDSCETNVNEKMGRGPQQFEQVKRIVNYMKQHHPRVRIKVNSMAGRYNKDTFEQLAKTLMSWNIDQWRIFRFVNLRGTALENGSDYWITESEFNAICNLAKKAAEISQTKPVLDFIGHDAIEENYMLICSNGAVLVTRDKKDIEIGNLVNENMEEIAARV